MPTIFVVAPIIRLDAILWENSQPTIESFGLWRQKTKVQLSDSLHVVSFELGTPGSSLLMCQSQFNSTELAAFAQ